MNTHPKLSDMYRLAIVPPNKALHRSTLVFWLSNVVSFVYAFHCSRLIPLGRVPGELGRYADRHNTQEKRNDK